MLIPINELKVSDIVITTVGGSPLVVNEITQSGVLFSDGTILESGWVNAIGATKSLVFYRNTQSGISHAYVGMTPLCGTMHGQDTVTDDSCTCEKCKNMLSK